MTSGHRDADGTGRPLSGVADFAATAVVIVSAVLAVVCALAALIHGSEMFNLVYDWAKNPALRFPGRFVVGKAILFLSNAVLAYVVFTFVAAVRHWQKRRRA